MTTPPFKALLSATFIIAISASACSVTTTDTGTGTKPVATLSKGDIETGAMAALSAKTGKTAPQITCPGDMKAEVGATQICAIQLDGKTFDVTITVTTVDENGKGQYTAEVAAAPRA